MGSIVTINASTTRLESGPGDEAALSFDVANAVDRSVTVRAQVVAAQSGAPDPGWLQVQGDAQFTLAPAEVRQVSVAGTPPGGSFRVALEVFETALPEENVDRSAPVEIIAGAPAAGGGKGWVLPVVIAAAVLVLAIGGGVAWWLLRDPGLPDVAGMSQAEAIAALQEREYTETQIVPVVAPDEASGTVLSAEIVAGTEEDDPPIVRVEVASSGLPDVAGLDSAAAEAALLAAGVGDVTITLVSAPAEQAGQVLEQDPAAQDVFDDSTVVQLAVGGITVPNLRGQRFNEANRALRDSGLVLGDRRDMDDARAAAGTILGSDPRAGSLVAAGAPVDLVVDNQDPAPTPRQLEEDCLEVNPDRLEITNLSNRFRVGEPGRSRFMLDTERAAKQVVFVMQKYEIDEICYVERPQPPMMYLKTRGKAPQGDLPGERCERFDPRRVELKRDGAQYVMTNAAGGEIRFDTREGATLAREVIQEYQMTHLCTARAPFGKFHYFRR